MTGLKLITFDLDNTLWPVDEVIRQAEKTCSDWIAEHHPSAAAALTAERVRMVRDELVRAHPDYLNNLTRLRRDAMAQAFIEAGFKDKEARHIAADAFQVFHEARNQVTFFPGALEVLETLADSYTLGALSNGNADLKRIGIRELFGFHHSAESIGRRKPDPDMFQAALHSAGVQPEQALHVGDHPVEDVDAARQHGFHAVWANLIDLRWPGDLDKPEHHIHHLRELTDLLPLFDDQARTTGTQTMSDRRGQLKQLLDDMQSELQALGLWEGRPPAPEAFESATPFFADRMDFSQWLQWVFIARFRALLAEQHPLPAQCDVAPMAEEALKELPQDTNTLVTLIAEFDDHFQAIR